MADSRALSSTRPSSRSVRSFPSLGPRAPLGTMHWHRHRILRTAIGCLQASLPACSDDLACGRKCQSCVCTWGVFLYQIARSRAIRGPVILFILLLPIGDQIYLLRKLFTRRDKGGILSLQIFCRSSAPCSSLHLCFLFVVYYGIIFNTHPWPAPTEPALSSLVYQVRFLLLSCDRTLPRFTFHLACVILGRFVALLRPSSSLSDPDSINSY